MYLRVVKASDKGWHGRHELQTLLINDVEKAAEDLGARSSDPFDICLDILNMSAAQVRKSVL